MNLIFLLGKIPLQLLGIFAFAFGLQGSHVQPGIDRKSPNYLDRMSHIEIATLALPEVKTVAHIALKHVPKTPAHDLLLQ